MNSNAIIALTLGSILAVGGFTYFLYSDKQSQIDQQTGIVTNLNDFGSRQVQPPLYGGKKSKKIRHRKHKRTYRK